ncbi:signal peptidase II [Tumebacillus lipolyticus]|uniref:Lipoprotein signal peptidase n=1 Tax=Tumebacillus lipolyticus TaxID=1280370 RepID=A0ABW4ZYV2_9BACL
MNRSQLVFWISTCFVFAVDRVTKVWAERTLQVGESVPGIDGWYDWTLYYNPGAAGGIFSGQLGFLIIVSSLAILALIWYMRKGQHDNNLVLQLGLGMMLGGAIGNLFDRVFYGHVIDFINPIDKSYIFNLADKGIRYGLYLGLIGLLLVSWKRRRAAKRLAAERSAE